MTYEEKRELRLQISQLLADAGFNQKVIKEMVVEEIKNKVERAVNQAMRSLDAECRSGNFVREKVQNMLSNTYFNKHVFSEVLKDELKDRVIQVVLKNVEEI